MMLYDASTTFDAYEIPIFIKTNKNCIVTLTSVFRLTYLILKLTLVKFYQKKLTKLAIKKILINIF